MFLLMQIKDQLRAAEKTLDDVSKLIKPLTPQLDELKGLLHDGDQLAHDASDDADEAVDNAAAANEVGDLLL